MPEPTTASYDADGTGAVDLVNFVAMVRDFDWALCGPGSPHGAQDAALLADQGLYEAAFPHDALGFKVRNDLSRPGEVAVSSILDPGNAEKGMFLGDAVVAVNGAPLGYANDHRVLAVKIKGLGRPLRLTFRRNFCEADVAAEKAEKTKRQQDTEARLAEQQQQQAAQARAEASGGGNSAAKLATEDDQLTEDGGDSSAAGSPTMGSLAGSLGGDGNDDDDDYGSDDESVLSSSAASREERRAAAGQRSTATAVGNGFTYEELRAAFLTFDADESDALDTFELAACLASLLQRPVSTPEMVRLVQEFDDDASNTLDLGEFLRMFREHDFSKEVRGSGPSLWLLATCLVADRPAVLLC